MQLTKARAALKAGAGMTLEFAMRKKWIAGLTTLVLLSGSLEGAVPTAGDTARDAYIEAWFLETAEADLEGALKAYGLCVERAGSGDRELAAKATWRMGRIARARGEEEVAVGLFERVVADYAGTDAAGRAAKDLAGEEEAAVQKEDAAITEAREFLGDMLDNREAYTHEKWRFVLDTLSVEEVLAIDERRGGDLDFLVQRDGDYRTDEKIVIGLARASNGLRKLLENLGHPARYKVTDSLLAHGQENMGIGELLMTELGIRGDDASFAQLRKLLDGKAFSGPGIHYWTVDALMECGQPDAAGILSARLEQALDADVLSPNSWPRGRLYERSAAADVLRKAFRRLAPATREYVYQHVGLKDDPGPLMDVWMNDPEPSLREIAFGRMIRSADAEARAEGVRHFVDAGRPWAADLLIQSIREIPSDVLGEEVLPLVTLAPTALRDPMYRALFYRFPKSAAAILDYANRSGHPEALVAAFSFRYGWEGPLRVNASTYYGGGVRSEGSRNGDAMGSIVAYPDSSLMERLGVVVAASDDVRLRASYVDFLRYAADQSAQAGACRAAQLFLRDPVPEVRQNIQNALFAGLSRESRLTLIGDPSAALSKMFLSLESDEEVLSQLANTVAIDRLDTLMGRAQQLGYSDVLRKAYDRSTSNDSGAAYEAFMYLAESDLDILVDTLGRSGSVGRLQIESVKKLSRLPLADDLRTMVHELSDSREGLRFREASQALRARYDEVEAAWRQFEIAGAVNNSYGGSFDGAAARRLAGLGALEELREMSRQPDSAPTGIHGLMLLGERKAVREALEVSFNPGHFVNLLVHEGMADLATELVNNGRVKASVVGAAMVSSSGSVQADFMVGSAEQESGRRHGVTSQTRLGAIEFLRTTKDVERLLRATRYYHEETSASGLLEAQAYEAVLDNLPWWRDPARSYTVAELQRLTGKPQGSAKWPEFQSEQQELIKAWREALANLPEDNPPEEDN